MDDQSYTIRVPKRWARTAAIVGLTALIVAPLTAVATHTFTDVPDSHTFHNDITWLADADVTRGCNPPDNTEFCPDDNVTRGQMAAFMKRLAEGTVVDAATVGGLSSAQLSVQGWVRVVGESVGLDTDGQIGSSQAQCPDGTMLTGGGHATTDGVPNINVFRSWPVSDTMWEVTAEKVDGSPNRVFRAYAICAVVNP